MLKSNASSVASLSNHPSKMLPSGIHHLLMRRWVLILKPPRADVRLQKIAILLEQRVPINSLNNSSATTTATANNDIINWREIIRIFITTIASNAAAADTHTNSIATKTTTATISTISAAI